MAQKLFGTDGIRGKVGSYPLTEEAVFKLGRAIGFWLDDQRAQFNKKTVIAKDTRESGDSFEQAISAGLISSGAEVVPVGVMPTPAVAYFMKRGGFGLGIVISASHNAAGENGIKFFDRQGFKLCEDDERKIEEIVGHIGEKEGQRPFISSKKKRCPYFHFDFRNEYIEFIIASADGLDLKGKRIVIDCAQGALSHLGKEVFERMGAEAISLNDTPDGNNVNLNSGALHPEVTASYVLEKQADAGFSFDGDGDRVIAIDEKGNILDGDFIIAILAKGFISKNKLSNQTVVYTHMSNGGLDVSLKAMGAKTFHTDVGDRSVLREMLNRKAVLGGEQSGHIILLDYATTADSLITALQVLKVMVEQGESLSTLSTCMKKIPQVIVNVRVQERKPFDSIAGIGDMVTAYRNKLSAKGGRILLRYSGTESVARIMIEGEQEEEINQFAHSLAEKIREAIGAKDEIGS